MWNRQREATEAEELARRVANDPEGFVKRGMPAAE
jgi:ATP-binding cassette subfamily B protein